MNNITTCLWFNKEAEEAANFYVKLFSEGGREEKIGKTAHYSESSSEVSGQPNGSVLTVEFELDGSSFLGLNGGPLFKFTEAISFIIDCEKQEEIDYFWNKLTADGGAESQCGWLKDKFGLSWQVVPKALNDLMSDPNHRKSAAVMKALLSMKKLDIKTPKQAGEEV